MILENKFYSIHERMPVEDDSYIIYVIVPRSHGKHYCNIYIAEWCKGKWEGVNSDNIVVGWAPIPEVPEGTPFYF